MVKVSYHDSADFTADMDDVGEKIIQAMGLMEAPCWQEWMASTDANFSVNATERSLLLLAHLKAALNAYNLLGDELDKAV